MEQGGPHPVLHNPMIAADVVTPEILIFSEFILLAFFSWTPKYFLVQNVIELLSEMIFC